MNMFEGYAEHFERRMRDISLEYEDDPEDGRMHVRDA